jgi:hypothetical protein
MTEIVDFLNNVTTKNFVEAEKQFSELLNDRLSTRLENEKMNVAAKVFNGATDEAEVESQDEVDLSSEQETETEVEDENV